MPKKTETSNCWKAVEMIYKKEVNMRFTKYFIILLLLYSCSSSGNKQENSKKEQVTTEERWKEISKPPPKSDCRKHVKLLSVDFWAKEMGRSRMYVLTEYKINTFKNESANRKGYYVGELIPGSKALIIEEGKDDYKIKSPLDGTIGWISKIQVEKTLYMNINTLEPCTPN